MFYIFGTAEKQNKINYKSADFDNPCEKYR